MTDTLDRSTDQANDGLCDTLGQALDDDALIARYVESGPLNLGPSDARMTDHGAPVWMLIAYHEGTGSDISRTAAAYSLEIEAVEAAIRYYCRHRALIDARILLNRSYFLQ